MEQLGKIPFFPSHRRHWSFYIQNGSMERLRVFQDDAKLLGLADEFFYLSSFSREAKPRHSYLKIFINKKTAGTLNEKIQQENWKKCEFQYRGVH